MKVLIVEDHPQAAEVLCEAVQGGLNCTALDMVSNLSNARQCLGHNQYDFVLLDLQLPDGIGLELIEAIKANNAHTTIVVTTIFDDDDSIFQALRLGASGYLLKGHSAEEIAVFLQNTLHGYPPLSASIAQSVLAHFRAGSVPAFQQVAEQGLQELTAREQEILVFVAKGYSVKEVSELLGIAHNTVAAHVKSVYKKLDLHNRAEATAMAVTMNLYQP